MRKVCEYCGKIFSTSFKNQKYCCKSCARLSNELGTLCWSCDNYHCSWLRDFTPVKGWVAKSRPYILRHGEKKTTYRVSQCPEYIKVVKKYGKK